MNTQAYAGSRYQTKRMNSQATRTQTTNSLKNMGMDGSMLFPCGLKQKGSDIKRKRIKKVKFPFKTLVRIHNCFTRDALRKRFDAEYARQI